METLPQIDFQGMEPSADLRARIEEHIARLEDRYGRITACRVVVKAPGSRHHTGGLYEFHIRLVLPDGREVAIERTPHLDERFQNLDFALNDVFKRARRRLQDQVRRLRGQVKAHVATTPTGIVKKLLAGEDYGFLEAADGREIYFHANSVANRGFARLEIGEHVHFVEEAGENGPQAIVVKPLASSEP
jgi:cold shock CspA family protein